MSQIRTNEIRSGDGTTTTEVNIPSLERRFAAAWVNFNGTGVPSIRESYNVDSITDNGTGDYTVNFTGTFVNTNYVANYTNERIISFIVSYSTSNIRLASRSGVATAADSEFSNLTVFSN